MAYRRTHSLLWLAASAAACSAASAQILFATDVSYNGGSYSQNFDSLHNLPNDTYNNATATPQIWVDNTAPFTDPGANVTLNTDGLDGWYFNAPAGTVYQISDGTPKSKGTLTGGLYNFGSSATLPGTNTSTDRALGLVGTNDTVIFGVKLINTSNITYTQLNIGYTGEEWFSGTVAKTLAFNYGIFDATVNSTLASAISSDASLNFTSPFVNNGTGGIAMDGNLIASQQSVSAVERNLTWSPGQVLWLTWQMPAISKGSGLAIDNLTFSADISPARNLVWNPGTTNWNTAPGNTNWLNGVSASGFTGGDLVTFGDAAVGSVVVDAAGVVPGAWNVTNSNGTYTFTGGSVGGNVALNKTGAGTLVLNASNSYTGGTSVTTGTLSISNDNNLGGIGNVSLSTGATLRFTAPITSTRTFNAVVGSTTLDTGAADSSVGVLTAAGGSLNKIGNGKLTVSSITMGANTLSVSAGSLVLNASSGTSTFAAAGSYAGNIVLAGPTRLSINGGTIDGGGQILLTASGATFNAAGSSATTLVENNVVINPNALTPFVAHIGATSTDVMQIDGTISGTGDVMITNNLDNGGAGLVLFTNHNTYSGATLINLSTLGVLRMGTSNALPATTPLMFGDGVNTGDLGSVDLNGFNLKIAGIGTALVNGNGNTPQVAYGIANTGGDSGLSPSTLTLSGNVTSTYDSTIGIPTFANGTISQLGGAIDAITLELDSANTGSLTLTKANNYSGGTILEGGTLIVSSDVNLGAASGPLSFNGGTLRITGTSFTSTAHSLNWGSNGGGWDIADSGNTFTLATSLTGGAIRKLGPGTLVFGGNVIVNTGAATSVSGGVLRFNGANNSLAAISGAGKLLVGSGAKFTSDGVTTAALEVDGSLTIRANGSTSGVSEISALTLAGGTSAWIGKLDLTNNPLILLNTDTISKAAAVSMLQNQIGYAQTHGGLGITSSTATTHGFTTLALVDNGNLHLSSYRGVTGLDDNSLIVVRAHDGDVNLDGKVNSLDLTTIANNWQKSTGSLWSQGDFNGDGAVNSLDLTTIANNWQFSGSSLQAALAQFPQFGGASSVPEPASLGVLALGGAALLARRKRRQAPRPTTARSSSFRIGHTL